ncbi:MAG: MBL fold metallo-hydrolase [Bacilli bacterium]|jgi:phosphoribosyl 1,2-cyclic phosphodiesterase|nr:MBL fold metallo-hydrolase [Bacilli bacterium]
MKICVLASGSEGNSTFLSTGQHKILIDMGKNMKYITEKLKEIGEDPASIEAIIISHTHNDHISSLERFIKKYHTKVYMTQKMFYDLENLEQYENIIIYEEDIKIDNLKIHSIKTSHDVSDSRNFIIEEKNDSAVYLTDTGYLNRKYFELLKNKNYYLFESNHDIAMLMNGPYPKWLKTRVLGTYGHLSNKDASFYLTKLVGENTKKIVLMHLSHKNNTEEKALQMIHDTFKEYQIDFENITCARQNEVTKVCND